MVPNRNTHLKYIESYSIILRIIQIQVNKKYTKYGKKRQETYWKFKENYCT